MRPTFSIIILTYNGRHHLERYLSGVLSTIGPDDEVLVADNASTDGTSEWMDRMHPECGYVAMDANHGYCGGNNRAAGRARGDVLLFLNNDVQVEAGWLEPLRAAFLDPGLWAAQPKILSLREPKRFEYAGASGGHVDWLGYPFCRGRIFHVTEPDHGQYDDSSPILWASGAALAIRREHFSELGGFDETFEFHMEEIDLCWRAWNRGGRVMAVPSSKVFHLGGGSLDRDNPRKAFYNYRNNLCMLVKNVEGPKVIALILARLVLDGLSSVPHALKGRWSFVGAIIRAHLAFYGRLPGLLRIRREISAGLSPNRPLHPLYRRSVVIQAFLFGRWTFRELPNSDHILG